MISKAKEETMQWLFQAPMEETIRSLQEKCTEIVEDSYSYLSRKIDFGTREQKLLKKVLNASLQRMIKEPIQELKHLETRQEQADYKKMVEQLFGIETKERKMTYEIYHRIKRITPCTDPDKICSGKISESLSRTHF